MIEPLTQGEVEEAITALSQTMELAIEELAQYSQEAANAEADYKIEYAKHLLKTKDMAATKMEKPTVAELEARALLGTSRLLRERLVAEAKHETAVEKLRTLRSRIDALRTLSANLRQVT